MQDEMTKQGLKLSLTSLVTTRLFYNRVRRHKHLDQLSPLEFVRKRQTDL